MALTDAYSDATEVLQHVRQYGHALIKVIQPNDVGATGSHQSGFHLPKGAWQLFSPRPPEKGTNWAYPVEITWGNGTVTSSELKWWGKGTRSEFHLTRFNRIRRFYARDPENVGGLLVLIPSDDGEWLAHVIARDEDREELESALGVDLSLSSWFVYSDDSVDRMDTITVSQCIDRATAKVAASVLAFPPGAVMAELAGEIVGSCAEHASEDDLLMERLRAEFLLFRAIEHRMHIDEVRRGFASLDRFLELAQTLTQRRKSRAGKSLEIHFQELLSRRALPFEAQPKLSGTRPDFVFPDAGAYYKDPQSCVVLAVKTTCKDRWRQVVQEAPLAPVKYLLTTQRGVSSSQIDEMAAANVRLVVPVELHGEFVATDRRRLMSVQQFMDMIAELN